MPRKQHKKVCTICHACQIPKVDIIHRSKFYCAACVTKMRLLNTHLLPKKGFRKFGLRP